MTTDIQIPVVTNPQGEEIFLHKIFFNHFLNLWRFIAQKNYLFDKEKILAQIKKENTVGWSKMFPELTFYIELSEKGNPTLVFPEFKAEVKVSLETIPPIRGIINYDWKWEILNEKDIPDKYLEEVKNFAIAAVNFQQRVVAGSTTAYWQNVTLDNYAREMYHYQFPTNEDQVQFESQFLKS